MTTFPLSLPLTSLPPPHPAALKATVEEGRLGKTNEVLHSKLENFRTTSLNSTGLEGGYRVEHCQGNAEGEWTPVKLVIGGKTYKAGKR